ncbi:OmpA family protein [Luteolibacter arcticus]|uniref:OmpA family protein n=1 Tax=Luteolibacter arcticus TaxID=1581411 RepID=A0ABT3GRE8_9BACT|nr:OmpA family protein [Luteolibacter arcticus]MCW1926043.1 OmpA family protein [Luteolibacter arcticus]
MNEHPATPEPEQHDVETSPDTGKSSVTLPTSVMALGFIAIALVGVLIAMAIKSRPAAEAAAGATDENDPAMREAKAKVQLLQTSLNQERAKLGLSPLYGQTTESAEAVAVRISEDAATLVDMAKGVKDLIAQKDAELDVRTKEWTDAVKLQGVLREQANRLQAELNKALIDGSDANGLRLQLEAANKRIISLGDEIRRLSQGSGALAQITAERDELRARVAELESRLSQASLFAGSEGELLKDAVQLFRRLRELENKPDSEIATAYSQFGAQLGANVLDKIDFPTGASDVPPEVGQRIAGFPSQAPDNALLLVVGYASETGNVDSNRSLSSDRATAVARVLDQVKKPGQRVQAVYLGQTDRFGSKFPERNQISEVWQIVPKSDGDNGNSGAPPLRPLPPLPGQ